MAIALAQGASNNGTVTPATPSSLTTTAGNLLILVIFAAGTSPTIATPAGWTLIQRNGGAATVFAMFELAGANNPGGATNPSSVLGGTITGWAAGMWEFSGQGSNLNYETLLGSAVTSQTATAIPNVFAGQPGPMPQTNLLWVYALGYVTATLTAANSGLAWSADQNPQSANGVNLDFFWGTNPGPGPFPSAAGTLNASVASRTVGAWFNSVSSQPMTANNIGGNAGYLVGTFYQGMIGGD